MTTGSWVQIVCLVLLILFSAFFSASETAFTSLNKIRLKTMADDGNKKAAKAYKMAENYDKLLSTVLVGNNIVNITASSVATVLFIRLINESKGPTVSTIIMTVLLLIFGEVTPKTLAKEMPEKYAMFATPFLRALTVILTPAVAFFMLWKKLLSKIFKFKKDDTITGDELLNIVDEAESGGGLDEDESDLIRSAISFYECPVGDILTPRVDVIAVSKDDSVEKIASVFNDSGFSRLPVYSDDTDDIIGFIHIRDFNKYVLTKKQPISSIIKKTVYIAKQMQISELLKLMQQKKTHMAVVADEFGGTLGIVTMEDILEELVGEIWDENDEVIEDFSPQPDGTVKVLGGAQLDKMFEYFDMDEDEESESVSVGGWVLEQLGKMAEVGDTFEYKNLSVTVTDVEQRRVIEISVKVEEPKEENEDDKAGFFRLSFCYIVLARPISSGMVTIEMKLTIATVWDASPVSLLYFAAKTTVMFAGGALAAIIIAVSSAPVMPQSLKTPRHMSGITASFISATQSIRHSLSADFIFAFERYVPKISIATGVLSAAR